MTDSELIDWLESCEFCLTTHREKTVDYFEIWWTVTTARGRSLTHPYGNVRDAIRAAHKAVTNAGEPESSKAGEGSK